jgi:hypothetical protein
MWFLFCAFVVVLLAGLSVGGALGTVARWWGTRRVRSLLLCAVLTASLAPIGAHYLWSRDRAERVIRQIEENVVADPEHYSTTDVRASRAALVRFTWIAPFLLGILYVLSLTRTGSRFWLRRFFPTIAVVCYVLAAKSLLFDPLGRHGYEALFHLNDAGKLTVWALVLCAGVQVGLFGYVRAAPDAPGENTPP